MNKKTPYIILSALFFVAFLVVQFGSMYGNKGWVKLFFILLSVSFLSSALYNRKSK